jgi:DNA/RNA-binding domain of Phe-tRNA-synthetase-like protein
MIGVSDAFRSVWPEARLGVLFMSGAANPADHQGLDERKKELEETLRRRHAGWDRQRLKEIPVAAAYAAYYRRFGQSYHVLLQLESVALKGRHLPSIAALVETMFMAELASLILTAGHDGASLAQPLMLDVASGGERYTGLNGKEMTCTRGDMMIRDAAGVISSVLHGPDSRTRITPRTTSVLFTAYAPEGVREDEVRGHLQTIEGLVRLISPEAATTESTIL